MQSMEINDNNSIKNESTSDDDILINKIKQNLGNNKSCNSRSSKKESIKKQKSNSELGIKKNTKKSLGIKKEEEKKKNK